MSGAQEEQQARAAAAEGERVLFGWNILVKNFTVGALFGYSSVNSTLSLNVPSSHAVSSGLRSRGPRASADIPKQSRSAAAAGSHIKKEAGRGRTQR